MLPKWPQVSEREVSRILGKVTGLFRLTVAIVAIHNYIWKIADSQLERKHWVEHSGELIKFGTGTSEVMWPKNEVEKQWKQDGGRRAREEDVCRLKRKA